MSNKIKEELISVSKDIYDCRACDFHNQLKKKNYYINPDPPSYEDTINEDHRVMVIGINPGYLEDDNYVSFKSCYEEDSYRGYSDCIVRVTKEYNNRNKTQKIGPYQRNLTSLVNLLNRELKIFKNGDIQPAGIYQHVFWSNLCFCPSKNSHERIIDGKKFGCNIFSEEIHNCLEKKFLSRFIKLKKPEIIIFFANTALQVINYKLLLKKLFNLDDYSNIDEYNKELHPAYKNKKGKDIYVFIKACKIKQSMTKILFFPHPNYQFKKSNKKTAIKKVCQWFSKND